MNMKIITKRYTVRTTKAQLRRARAAKLRLPKPPAPKTRTGSPRKSKLQRHVFPVLDGEPMMPSNGMCPQCRRIKVMGSHPTVILSGGAMRVVDARTRSAEMADDCIGMLRILTHRHDDGPEAMLSLANDTPGGQWEFYFCSPKCLRRYLNAAVDEFELRLCNADPRLTERLPREISNPFFARAVQEADWPHVPLVPPPATVTEYVQLPAAVLKRLRARAKREGKSMRDALHAAALLWLRS